MNNRRSNIVVIADILRLGQAGKTEIMYSAKMSHRQLQEYLEFLVQNGFIDVMKVGNPVTVYKVNEKGLRLLKTIESLLKMIPLKDEEGCRIC